MSGLPAYKTASVSELIPYARNSRTHSQHQIDLIAASIREFGFLNPVIVDGEQGIIAGHGRVMAAKKLGMETVPVLMASHLTDAQKRAYVIADNRLAEVGSEWDDEMLRVEFAELSALDFDVGLTGFALNEIEGLDFDAGEDIEMPELADGDKEPFQQKTFTLHDEQAAIVEDAVTLARAMPESDTGINENSNGNALALICEQWLEAQHG